MGNVSSLERSETLLNQLGINVVELSEHTIGQDNEESRIWVEQIVVQKLHEHGMTLEQGMRRYREEIEPHLIARIQEETTRKLEEFKNAQAQARTKRRTNVQKLINDQARTFEGQLESHKNDVQEKLEKQNAEVQEHIQDHKCRVQEELQKQKAEQEQLHEQTVAEFQKHLQELDANSVTIKEYIDRSTEDRFQSHKKSMEELEKQTTQDLQTHKTDVKDELEKQKAEFEELSVTLKKQGEKLNSVDQEMQKTKEKLSILEKKVELAKEERKQSENKLNEVKEKIKYQHDKMQHEMDPRTRQANENKRNHEREMANKKSDRISRILEMQQKLTPEQFDKVLTFLTMDEQNCEKVGVEELDREPDTQQLNLPELDNFADIPQPQFEQFTASI